MSIGISTSCMYPLETERALEQLGKSGIKTTEIFFNSPTELVSPLLDELLRIKTEYGINVRSVHPYLSFGEAYLLFSDYKRRFYDTLDMYKRFMSAAQTLGADTMVIHGNKLPTAISDDEYYDRFRILVEKGEEFGVRVAQENVVNFSSMSLDFLQGMRDALGEKFYMVLDIKQTVRSGVSAFDLIDKLHENIIHVHISDNGDAGDCLTPLTGNFDFARLFSTLDGYNYRGDYVIELYRKDFGELSELTDAVRGLEKIYEKIK